ncbi:hypothetical protein S245_065648, partial [Arachis hypogaea]
MSPNILRGAARIPHCITPAPPRRAITTSSPARCSNYRPCKCSHRLSSSPLRRTARSGRRLAHPVAPSQLPPHAPQQPLTMQVKPSFALFFLAWHCAFQTKMLPVYFRILQSPPKVAITC